MNSIAERLQSIAAMPPAPPVTGHWFNIRICPDLALGELLNVGVGYIDSATQQIYTKVIDRFDRFRSLYGEGFEDEIRVMLRIAQNTITGTSRESPSPNIRFSDFKFAAGSSVDDILERLYEATIEVVSPVATMEAEAREATAGNDVVRKSVFDELKRIAGLSAEKILAAQPLYMVTENERSHALDIPLRGVSHLGSVVSAKYKTMQVIETNLLRASVDLETASRLFKQDHVGLFVLRPRLDPIAFTENRLTQIDNVIDTIGWKLHKQGVHVAVDEEPSVLAQDIVEWAAVRA